MTNTEKLKDMLDDLINGKPEQAQVAFHDYLKTKMSGTPEEQQETIQNTENTKE